MVNNSQRFTNIQKCPRAPNNSRKIQEKFPKIQKVFKNFQRKIPENSQILENLKKKKKSPKYCCYEGPV